MSTLRVPAPRSTSRTGNMAWLLGGIIFALLISLLVSFFSRPTDKTLLSINNAQGNGTMALAQILRAHGKTVENGYQFSDLKPGTNQTVVITQLGWFDEEKLTEIVQKADSVLFLGTWLQDWAVQQWAVNGENRVPQGTPPHCDWPVAQRAGTISESTYSLKPQTGLTEARTQVLGCYPNRSGEFAVVVAKEGAKTLTLVADQKLFTNEYLDKDGNAALALGILGASDNILWLAGDNFGSEPSRKPVLSYIDPWVFAAAALVALAVVLWGLATGWRFGPVLRSRLPVTVASGEVVRGRARLLEKHRAWGHLLQILRRNTAQKISRQLLIPAQSSATEVLQAIERATGERQLAQHALYSPPPSRISEVLQIVKELQTVERQIEQQQIEQAQKTEGNPDV